jgi:hypothetical protein
MNNSNKQITEEKTENEKALDSWRPVNLSVKKKSTNKIVDGNLSAVNNSKKIKKKLSKNLKLKFMKSIPSGDVEVLSAGKSKGPKVNNFMDSETDSP